MAANIFNQNDYSQILTRINKLNASSQRRWGKMNLPQMLEHCSIQLKKALGIIPAAAMEGPAIYRTGIGSWLALYVAPWPKGSKTPAVMNMETNGVTAQEFMIEKKQLIDFLQQIQQQESFHPHPFFGSLNKKNWGRLIWKHLDHHLRQFNA
jgi:hypothetical protein